MKYLLFFGIVQSFLLLGQAGAKRMHSASGYAFVQNKKQWPSTVKYAVDIPGGRLYLHDRSMTYSFYGFKDKQGQGHGHSLRNTEEDHVHGYNPSQISTCSYSINFLGAAKNPQLQGTSMLPTKHNYIKGPDAELWSVGANTYSQVTYSELYPHVDMELKEHQGILKYEFVVKKGADLNNIKLEYVGTRGLSLHKGSLWVKTALGTVIEQRPYCYQIIDGNKKEIKSKYVVKKNTLSFALLEAYDPAYTLVIDPEIVFSTYSGSSFDNWGNTATYDKDGNLYSGGIVFGHKFPNSASDPYDTGDIDIAIYKYNAKGTRAEYITYIGGDLAEVPHSLLVNAAGELIILGITGSSNAPTSVNAFDRSFNGGTQMTAMSGVYFQSGTDLYVAKLDGSGNLANATYIGGSGNDGANRFMAANYGDVFRGDIAVDGQNNICIGSNTSSTDFPLVNGLATAYKGGASDGLICQLAADLSSIRWDALIGGSMADAIYSIKTAKNGEILVSGGTASTDLPTSSSALHPVALGKEDGFVMRVAADGSAILASTYLGTDSSDQAYFVQLDSDEDVYVLGQTKGPYPIKDAMYSVVNSGQFIQKLDKSLSLSMLSTVFGSGSGSPDISPTAFLVNDCDKIYVTGWGGSVNRNYMRGSTQNLPVTPDAFQTYTDGSDFYLCVFEKDMAGLVYATFFGGNSKDASYRRSHGEHVDGGTSRFDPKGIVYHAVCSCGDINYPTYPDNVWSDKNNSPLEELYDPNNNVNYYERSCNNAAFKFDLFEIDAKVEADDTLGCSPFVVNYKNHSKGGITYKWYINGAPIQTTSDTSIGLTRTYTKAGTYKLMLVVTNNATCKLNDTDYVSIVVDTVLTKVAPPAPICKGDDRTFLAKIDSSATSKYVWSPGKYLSDSTIANPVAFPPKTTLFKVLSTNDNGCSKLDSIVLTVHPPPLVKAGKDTTICYGNKVKLKASGAQKYYWTPADSVANPYSEQTDTGPYANSEFYVEGTDTNGCKAKDTLKVKVTYLPVVLEDTAVCKGGSVVLRPQASQAIKYLWMPSSYLSQNNIANPTSKPLRNITYTLSIEDAMGCKSSGKDTLAVRLRDVSIKMTHDTVLCRNMPATIKVTGAATYIWNRSAPELVCQQPECGHVTIVPADSVRWFVVDATDKYGCKTKDSLKTLYKPAIVPVVEFEYSAPRCVGASGTFKGRVMALDQVCYVPKWLWDFGDQTTDTSANPTHVYKKEGVYPVSLTLNGSKPFVKILNVLSEDSCLKNIYIPNTFTPNGDGINDLLFVRGINIVKVQFHLYNNLGEKVFYTDNLHSGWDGVYKGEKQTAQVYVYHCDATFWDGTSVSKEGNVTLLE